VSQDFEQTNAGLGRNLIVRRFGEAAARAAAAGVDALDINGHTGHLIDQFMSPVWNCRTDGYGGREPLPLRHRGHPGRQGRRPGLPVSFRLSVDHRFPGGRTAEDSREIALVLERAGLDLMMADDGSYEAMNYVFPPCYLGDACIVSAAKALKEVLTIPVMEVGNLTSENAEAVLSARVSQVGPVCLRVPRRAAVRPLSCATATRHGMAARA
jgi:2-enoate reductase